MLTGWLLQFHQSIRMTLRLVVSAATSVRYNNITLLLSLVSIPKLLRGFDYQFGKLSPKRFIFSGPANYLVREYTLELLEQYQQTLGTSPSPFQASACFWVSPPVILLKMVVVNEAYDHFRSNFRSFQRDQDCAIYFKLINNKKVVVLNNKEDTPRNLGPEHLFVPRLRGRGGETDFGKLSTVYCLEKWKETLLSEQGSK